MKSRPRSVEREVAKSLTLHFAKLGMSLVERIPILGRTGPDITINESRLAIDVKSRKAVPGCNYYIYEPIMHDMRGRLFLKLKDFPLLYSDVERSGQLLLTSVAVAEWLEHMREWADKNNSIPAIVLHKPGTWIDNAVFVIYASDRIKLKEIYKSWQDDSSKNLQQSTLKEPPSLTAPWAATL
jgi:hypothetical protein